MEKIVTVQIHNLGELLAFTMKERGLGVREVAKALEISAATVSRITRGGNFQAKAIIPIAQWCALNKYEDAEELWDLLEPKE